MKMFKVMYIIASAYWLIFSVSIIAYLSGYLDFGRFVISGFLLVAILLEELYYMIEEKVIKHDYRIV